MSLPNVNEEKLDVVRQYLDLDAPLKMFVDKGLKVVFPVPFVLPLLTCALDETGSAQTVISGVVGKRIKVYGIMCVVTGAANVTFFSGSTALTGAMTFNGVGEGFQDGREPPNYVWVCKTGEDLKVTVSANSVKGYVLYWLE